MTGADTNISTGQTEIDVTGDKRRGTSPWVTAGIAGALGMEFVAATVGGLWLGHLADQRFGSEPLGLIVGMVLALIGVGVHIFGIVKKFLLEDASDGGEHDDPS